MFSANSSQPPKSLQDSLLDDFDAVDLEGTSLTDSAMISVLPDEPALDSLLHWEAHRAPLLRRCCWISNKTYPRRIVCALITGVFLLTFLVGLVVGSFVVAGKGTLIDEYVDLLAGTPSPNVIDTEAEIIPTSAPTQAATTTPVSTSTLLPADNWDNVVDGSQSSSSVGLVAAGSGFCTNYKELAHAATAHDCLVLSTAEPTCAHGDGAVISLGKPGGSRAMRCLCGLSQCGPIAGLNLGADGFDRFKRYASTESPTPWNPVNGGNRGPTREPSK